MWYHDSNDSPDLSDYASKGVLHQRASCGTEPFCEDSRLHDANPPQTVLHRSACIYIRLLLHSASPAIFSIGGRWFRAVDLVSTVWPHNIYSALRNRHYPLDVPPLCISTVIPPFHHDSNLKRSQSAEPTR